MPYITDIERLNRFNRNRGFLTGRVDRMGMRYRKLISPFNRLDPVARFGSKGKGGEYPKSYAGRRVA